MDRRARRTSDAAGRLAFLRDRGAEGSGGAGPLVPARGRGRHRVSAHNDQRETAQQVLDAARLATRDLTTLWRQRLEDADLDNDAALGAAPFRDLPAHLQSLSGKSGEPQALFQALYRTFVDLVDAERAIDALLQKHGIT